MFPKGPYADGGGPADTPQHCARCGRFLENPLTEDGARYVDDALREYEASGRGNRDVLRQWADFYGLARPRR